jgi:large subunit ribosomal protein L40e
VLDVRATDTVRDVKRVLQALESIPIERQRLVFQTRELQDAHTLADYNIQRDSNLGLMLRLAGGTSELKPLERSARRLAQSGRVSVTNASHIYSWRGAFKLFCVYVRLSYAHLSFVSVVLKDDISRY